MRAWHWQSGRFEPCDALPVSDRGFRYGMSLFETIRLWQGRPILMPEHVGRLRAACETRGFPLDEQALSAVGLLLAGQPDGVARLYITAGDGGLFSDSIDQPRLLVLCETRPQPVLAPCALTAAEEVFHSPFGGLKTGNYWRNIDALHQARRSGFDEALLFNENSELVSGSMSNVFVLAEGQLRTPALECGARDGVTRAWVKQQMPVCECSLFYDDLQKAEEIFVTNSWYGVRPVTRLLQQDLPPAQVGGKLAAAFQAVLGL